MEMVTWISLIDIWSNSIPISATNNEFLQSEYRGWKLYRIPINNINNYNIITNNPAINPSLSKISYARLWFEVDKTVRIKIAELNIVGNKWGRETYFTSQ